jgi:hypothetical protein
MSKVTKKRLELSLKQLKAVSRLHDDLFGLSTINRYAHTDAVKKLDDVHKRLWALYDGDIFD